MDTTSLLHFDDRLHVGLGAIDRTHEAFARCVNALVASPETDRRAALDALIAHLEEHFALEERLMAETKFPAAGCHADEHAGVMASAHEVRQLVAVGNFGAARDFAQALIDWFPGHSDHLDSALAIWIVKRQTQGAPLVLRRSLARTKVAEAAPA